MLPSMNYDLGKQRQQEHLGKVGNGEKQILQKGRSVSNAPPKFTQLTMTVVGILLVGYSVARTINPITVPTLDDLDLSNPAEIFEGMDPMEPAI